MHENKYLHLPVVEEDTGKVLGVVSVMEIIHATAGEKGSDRCGTMFRSPPCPFWIGRCLGIVWYNAEYIGPREQGCSMFGHLRACVSGGHRLLQARSPCVGNS